MVQVQDAIVRGGQIVVDGLPFQDGQHVRVSVTTTAPPEGSTGPVKRSIAEVQRLLAGSVVRFDDPTEPMIPLDDWEMLP